MIRLAALLLAFLAAAPALARDDGRYANADPIRRAWFKSLKHGGISCCDESDCRAVEYDVRGGKFWAHLVDERGDLGWREIPDDKVITDLDILRRNPTGSAVACWLGQTVYCFVPGSGL